MVVAPYPRAPTATRPKLSEITTTKAPFMRIGTCRRAVIAVLSAGLALSACDAGQESGENGADDAATLSDEVTVMATTSILGDVTAQVLGEDGAVEVIIPPGSDPHGYEASPRDAAMLREADLVVANGLQLEENLASALAAAEQDGARVLEVAPELDPIAFEDGAHDHDHGDDGDDVAHDHDGHDHGPADPHVWHDPLRMIDAVHLVAAELAELIGAQQADELQARADAYEQQLREVHTDVEAILAEIPADNRALITNHDSFNYLAARYDLEVLGTVIPGSSTDAATSPAEFAELITTLEQAQVPAVFSENVEADRLSEQLAGEVLDRADLEVEVVQLYSDALGEPGSPGETYLGMLRENAERIAAALG